MLGDILRNLLDERDITQKQLAHKLNIAPSTLGNYIQNVTEPDHEMLKCLADYFCVTIDYLLDHRTSHAMSHQEDELLRIFRSLTIDQQDFYIEQGKIFIAQNNKRGKSSHSEAAGSKGA